MNTSNKKLISYIGLIFVVFIWGCGPVLTLELYKYYSPTFRLFFTEIILVIFYLSASKNHIKEFNRDYLKAGIPTGLFLAFANITQKIGLMYTTPTKYSFLENLSCITVPVVMYLLVKKKPGIKTIIACFVCLASTFVINGMTFDSGSWGIGEILCAAAGLLYGFNIAGTGVFAKKLYAPLYLFVQACVGLIISFIFSLILNFTKITSSSGELIPVEKIYFSFKFEHLAFLIIFAIVSSGLCWIIRTNSMKHVSASAVAVIMPFSSIITATVSILAGKDTLDVYLIFGAILGIVAIILSGLDDVKGKNK